MAPALEVAFVQKEVPDEYEHHLTTVPTSAPTTVEVLIQDTKSTSHVSVPLWQLYAAAVWTQAITHMPTLNQDAVTKQVLLPLAEHSPFNGFSLWRSVIVRRSAPVSEGWLDGLTTGYVYFQDKDTGAVVNCGAVRENDPARMVVLHENQAPFDSYLDDDLYLRWYVPRLYCRISRHAAPTFVETAAALMAPSTEGVQLEDEDCLLATLVPPLALAVVVRPTDKLGLRRGRFQDSDHDGGVAHWPTTQKIVRVHEPLEVAFGYDRATRKGEVQRVLAWVPPQNKPLDGRAFELVWTDVGAVVENTQVWFTDRPLAALTDQVVTADLAQLMSRSGFKEFFGSTL